MLYVHLIFEEGTTLTYPMSIFMGFLQGVAEFLPISSSGHLALFQSFFGMENLEETQMLLDRKSVV